MIFLSFSVIILSSLLAIPVKTLMVPTKGEVWPKVQSRNSQSKFVVVLPSQFNFTVLGCSCDILSQALERYSRIITEISWYNSDTPLDNYSADPNFAGVLPSLKVNLTAACESYPYFKMDEAYTLKITSSFQAVLESKSIWGVLRGLETFSQLLTRMSSVPGLRLQLTTISDKPRFSWRGLMVDTARHFISPSILYKILDGMAYNKLNVFHWHIVDDESFPYESSSYPDLSAKGAYGSSFVYYQTIVSDIIEYARLRGIRVVVEFDTPGHTRSWGLSHPEILTTCREDLEGTLGPINPTSNVAYDFLDTFFREITKVFPDQFVHLGADEVDPSCWMSRNDIYEWMEQKSVADFEELQGVYIEKLIAKILALNKSAVVWQDPFFAGVPLPANTVLQLWNGNRWNLLSQVTKAGRRALLSESWYISSGGTWRDFYEVDPHDFSGTAAQKSLVLGGEACLWTEEIDDSNILQRLFPEICAPAEKLWCSINVNDADEAAPRLEEHYYRLINRGIPADPPNP